MSSLGMALLGPVRVVWAAEVHSLAPQTRYTIAGPAEATRVGSPPTTPSQSPLQRHPPSGITNHNNRNSALDTPTMTARPRLLLTLGDVAGIGPEIVARAWPELNDVCRP